jgi:SulP family sulfate permease
MAEVKGASTGDPGIPADRLEPKLLAVLREGYSARTFVHDLTAGVIVGIVALPLAIAFAIASGVKPEQGLYTAVVAGFLISALGGSRVQIGGPTGAFIVIVYGIVQRHGYEALAVATLMAGVLLILMGFARLGAVIKFVPYPVTIGFTAGIALIIGVSQIRDLLGLDMPAVPADFFDKLAAYGEHIGSWNPYALALGMLTAALVLLWPRVTRRVPGPLVAVLATTVLVQALGLPVETIEDRFGQVPSTLPVPALPIVDWTTARELFPSALSIALLGAIESLLSAVVADGMAGTRHRSNMELLAQGVANIASPIFGGIPATGAIARTATNVKNGGRTPIAGMIHAFTLLLIMLFFAPWASMIPLATLAGILLVIAYNMSEWRVFLHLFRSPRSDIIVLLVTFTLTVVVDLTIALQAGVVLAALLFMRRMAGLSQAVAIRNMLREDEGPDSAGADVGLAIPEGVEIYEVYGALFFGAASKFKDALRQTGRPPRILILRMRDVLAIDATGLRALEDVLDKTRRDRTILLLSGVHAQPLVALERSGLHARIGEENIVGSIDEALTRARQLLGLGPGGRHGSAAARSLTA